MYVIGLDKGYIHTGTYVYIFINVENDDVALTF